MAEYCAQCAKDHDFTPDWKGILSVEDCANGKILGPMLCEGCGHTYVDHRGACVGGCSLKSHGPWNPKYNQNLAHRTILRRKYSKRENLNLKIAKLENDIRKLTRNKQKGTMITINISIFRRMAKALQEYRKLENSISSKETRST